MRMTLFLLLFGVIQVMGNNSYGQITRLTMDLQDVSVENILDEIEDQSEFFFLYNHKLVDTERMVNVQVSEKKIGEVLDQIFAETTTTYVLMDRQIVLSPEKYNTAVKAALQPRTITGTILDPDGLPVVGASVIIKGTSVGTITDIEGRYSLSDIPDDATMVFSFIGMETQEIMVGVQTEINVSLQADAFGLEELVIIGYGTARKTDLTGAVVTVSAQELAATLQPNLALSLQGVVAGLEVGITNNRAGAEPEITIRGENSLSASNAPLIVLDGIPYTGSLNDINPSDIASINVLKDASSSAIYGARSSNGVMLITTKTGVKGKARVSFTNTSGVQTISNRINLQNGDQYLATIIEEHRWRTGDTPAPLDILTSNEIPNYEAGIQTDWIDEAYRNARTQENLLSISGGTDKTSYYNSFGYNYQEGLAIGNDYTRFTIRSNVSHRPTDWIEIGTNLQLTRSDYGGVSPDLAAVTYMSPYGKLYEEDGSYTFYPMFPNTFNTSPFANMTATSDDKRTAAIINGFVVFKPVKGLSYRLNLGYNINGQNHGQYYPKTSLSGRGADSWGDITNDNNQRWTVENILNYKLTAGAHSLDLTGLYSREGWSSEQSYSYGRGFVSDASLYYFLESAATKDVGSGLQEASIESLMGRVNYDFNKLFYATFTIRRDGYSGFGENQKYGTFPSAAVGWNISNQEFFKSSSALEFVNLLKFRFSYGLNGNMAIPPYRTLDSFYSMAYIFGDNSNTQTGFRNSVIGNPSLRWESTTSTNIGMDFSILNNRIGGSLELWNSHSNDLLMQQSVAVMNGYQSVWNNIGELGNKGIEFTLNTVNIIKGDFTWSTSFNFSRNTDEILALASGASEDLANLWIVGERLKINYNYELDGVWQLGEEDEIANSPQPSAQPGELKIKDVNDDGKINADDRVVQGSPTPNWRMGMNNEFKWRNWTASVFINANVGQSMDNANLNPVMWGVGHPNSCPVMDYWTPENPSNKIPSIGFVDPYRAAYFEDASFLRIKNVTLSYNFAPKGKIEEWGIDMLQFSFNCRNLYVFTNWVGWDPEQVVSGNSVQRTDPIPRAFNFSIKIDF